MSQMKCLGWWPLTIIQHKLVLRRTLEEPLPRHDEQNPAFVCTCLAPFHFIAAQAHAVTSTFINLHE